MISREPKFCCVGAATFGPPTWQGSASHHRNRSSELSGLTELARESTLSVGCTGISTLRRAPAPRDNERACLLLSAREAWSSDPEYDTVMEDEGPYHHENLCSGPGHKGS
jgi:hypothetical protein